MNPFKNIYLILLAVLFLFADVVVAQIQRGDPNALRIGVHRGNQVRTVFTNQGVIAQPGNRGPRGAWKYDTNEYIGDVSPLVGVLLPIDLDGDGVPDTDTASVVITQVDRPGGGDSSPGGSPWTFQPIPGFFNETLDATTELAIAMSHKPETWPTTSWPDQPTWVDEDGNVEWNGYFGRGQLNADQESYFWMDDNMDEKFFTRLGFLPDSTDPSRKGQALQMIIRGLQWQNFIAQDILFWLYEIHNAGTTTYKQAVFGALVGTYVGAGGTEYDDDVSFFEVRDAITYSYDFDNYISPSSNPRWQPTPHDVAYVAYAFLESPGNPFDGIDNDGDARNFSSAPPYFDNFDFDSKTLQAGDKLILIDQNTFERTVFTMPNSATTVTSMGVQFELVPGETVLEEGNRNAQTGTLNPNATDGIDNDLDGLIDENFQVHYRQLQIANIGTTTEQVLIDTLNPVQYKDYVNNIGLTEKMIDEARNDEIDNDDDWNPELDDVGADGKPDTGDFGEGDGIPTPGEPNFDRTDVDESDQIGLTSFQYFVPAGDITMSDENDMWRRMRPGFFDVPTIFVNNVATRGEDGDFIYASGYFPLLPEKTERFSLALAYGDDFRTVVKTKRVAQTIYNANYNFPKPPEKPTLTAVAGDEKVTLYWDKKAESSIDPTTKENDFEGYKIYKGTDADFSDAFVLTDGRGRKRAYEPIVQYDLDNGIKGYFESSASVDDLLDGLPYYLGDDTGIRNSYVDEDVINGRTYYYAIVAYDRGDPAKDIYPSENDKFLAINSLGQIETDINTAAVIPNAPVSGYVPPEDGTELSLVEGFAERTPYFEVVDETKVIDATYEVFFVDSLVSGTPLAYGYNVINTAFPNDTIFAQPKKMLPINGDVFDGVRISFDTSYQKLDSVRVNINRTYWTTPDSTSLRFSVVRRDYPSAGLFGVRDPRDYAFVFYDTYDKLSTPNMLGIPFGAVRSNFEIYDITNPEDKFKVPFSSTSRDTLLNTGDRIILSNRDTSVVTWSIDFFSDTSTVFPTAGDTFFVSIRKPFNASTKYNFTTRGYYYDQELARNNIKNVKAVPNPYVVTNMFEQPLPSQIRGRGERVINFINLPPASKIHIYTSAGNHVQTLYHDGNLESGTVSWDLRNKEGLDVAFGVYFYVVEADGISDKKFGKLAIIK